MVRITYKLMRIERTEQDFPTVTFELDGYAQKVRLNKSKEKGLYVTDVCGSRLSKFTLA